MQHADYQAYLSYRRAYQKAYNQSEKGKARASKYWQTDRYKLNRKLYYQRRKLREQGLPVPLELYARYHPL